MEAAKPFSSAKRRLRLAKRLRINAVSNRAGSELSSGFMAGGGEDAVNPLLVQQFKFALHVSPDVYKK